MRCVLTVLALLMLASRAGAQEFGEAPVEGGGNTDRPLTLARPLLSQEGATLRLTLAVTDDGAPASLPRYRVSLEQYPARVRIRLGRLARSEQLGWAATPEPLASEALGVLVVQSPDGEETLIELYLQRVCAFRVRELSRGQLRVEARPLERAALALLYAVYLPRADSAAQTWAWVEALHDADRPAAIVLDGAGWFRVQAGVYGSRREAEAAAGEVAALEGLPRTGLVVVQQPPFGRPAVGE